MSPNPILVEVVRSGVVESVHRGAVLITGPDGTPLLSVGDVATPVFARSSVKPLQAVAMLRSGLDAGAQELALASASHNGELAHVARARAMLARADCDEGDLRCPASLPMEASSARAVLVAGGGPARITMNCSGKHAAMLLTCRTAGWPTEGYLDPAHPLQQAVRAVVEELCAEPVAAVGVDGCGAPLFATSLTGLARAFSALVTAPEGSGPRRVADAMRAHPFLVAGTGREDTAMMQAVPGLLMKGGAEGVHAAALADGRSVTMKIDDGAARARPPVLVGALARLGVPVESLAQWARSPLAGGDAVVGEVRLRAGALD
ncbi:MAG: asparaginase [Geodermatophilaceae bacterium]|nr:asparaginase [Geodermatophilaceae bacterium]